MSAPALIGAAVTMSSREIAELTGKEHFHVMRDIEKMLKELDLNKEGCLQNWIHPQNGQTYPEYRLDRELTDTLLTGYSAVLRRAVIARWHELERQVPSPAALTTLEILQIALESEQGRIKAEAERDHAIATKAEIGTRREAVAMNTASVAVKKANRLEIELDKSKEYATVKRMEMAYHGTAFNWRLLKSASAEMGVPTIDVFDANYGTVKAYHASVWHEAYAVSINPEAVA